MSELKQDWEQEDVEHGGAIAWSALLPALLVFLLLWALCIVGFVVLLILSEPGRSKLLAILALFVLMVGTGASAGVAFSVYHKIRIRRNPPPDRPDPFNQVFTDREG